MIWNCNDSYWLIIKVESAEPIKSFNRQQKQDWGEKKPNAEQDIKIKKKLKA